MKKIMSLVITIALLLTSVSISFACDDQKYYGQFGPNQNWKTEKHGESNEPHSFKLDTNKIPFTQIIVDLGATVTFDKASSVLTVVKGANTVVIDFKLRTAALNGTAVTDSGLFAAKNCEQQMKALLMYLSKVLGGKGSGEAARLEAPTNVTVTPVGATVIANTLNASTLYMTAAAKIKAGQATGGKAELYVGSKLVATDSTIAATDTTVTFTTSDGTPDNAEMQALIPAGGAVTVKLYSADSKSATSKAGNPTLVVDYAAPVITGVTSAVYDPAAKRLYINVTGAGAAGDKLDVTKISLVDSAGKAYQLTNASETGSTGVVNSINSLVVTIGSADKTGLAGLGSAPLTLSVSAGSLLTDAAGNVSANFAAVQNIPVTVINQ